MNIFNVFSFMCSKEECMRNPITDIAKAYEHVRETGHEVYQFVMIGDKPQLCAIIDERIVNKPSNKIKKEK